MKHEPLVSIYLPTRNRVTLLERAINSVYSQTYSNIEIVIVDDNSIDQTKNFLKSSSLKYRNLKYFSLDSSGGPGRARNIAINQAQGEYIAGLDDDDEFLPDYIYELIKEFNPEEHSYITSSYIEDTGMSLINRRLDCGIISLNDILHYNKSGNQILTLTSRIREVGGFDENLSSSEDYDLWIRLIQGFGSAKKIPSLTYIRHTSNKDSRISSSLQKVISGHNLLLEKHRNILSSQHLRSQELDLIRKKGLPLTLRKVLSLINSGNWKMSLATYLHSNFPGLKKIMDALCKNYFRNEISKTRSSS